MELIDRSYEGFYARFDPPSQKDGVLLMGADNIVGSDYEIIFKTENGIKGRADAARLRSNLRCAIMSADDSSGRSRWKRK